MKKKLLLIALPALMVLSGCSNALIEQPALYNDANIMLEDNLAHEELFGEAKLEPKKLGVPDVDPGSDPSWTKAPKIGVQFKSYQKAETDYYAVRYVAAINDTAGMTATWSRGVSQKDSNQIKAMSHDHVSLVKYDSLNNDSTPVTAASEGFEKYIVYTMYDIPAAQDESYIAAYLTLSKDGEDDVVSKVVVTQLDGSNYFSFGMDQLVKDGYFMFNSRFGILEQDAGADTDPTDNGKNNAEFADIVINTGDKFGFFRFTTSVFQFYGRQTFIDETAAEFAKSTTIDQFAQLYYGGRYTFYINHINMVYITPLHVTPTLYFQPNTNWKSDGARFAAYVFHKVGDAEATATEWISMTETTSGSGVYKANIEIATHNYIIFCRMDGSKPANNWDNKWNQTGDLGMPVDYRWLSTHEKYALADSNPGDVDWNAYGGSWQALS